METVSAFRIMTKKFKVEDREKYELHRQVFCSILDELLTEFSSSSTDPSQTKADLSNLFPLHPATANLATYFAREAGSSSRSVFEFLACNEVKAFFDDEEAYANKETITSDYLWDYVQEYFESDSVRFGAVSGFTEFQYVIAGAPGIDPGYYKEYIGNHKASIVFDQTYRLLQQSKAALVTSGTATLETALFRVPQVVCYKTPVKKLVRFVFTHFFHIKYISLVNLIADKTVVQELFADSFSCQSIREELNKIIRVEAYRNTMLEGYDEVINRLGSPGASHRAARYMFESLSTPK
jgi:lipid-A-disaccharide synthase